MNILDWEKIIVNSCLTVKDIINLNNGDKIECLSLDRNILDIVENVNPEDKLLLPTEFFRQNKITYYHRKNLQGKIVFHNDGKDEIELENFEFDIEYIPNNWYPLKNGHLPPKDSQGISTFNYTEPKHWSEFEMHTRIGWRGPMIKWEYIDQFPKVYWDS